MTDDDVAAMLESHESAGAPRFAPGFADRVMARVGDDERARSTLTLDGALAGHVRRVLPSLLAASLVLALWNSRSVRGQAPSPIGAVLGVASVATVGLASPASVVGLTNVEAFE